MMIGSLVSGDFLGRTMTMPWLLQALIRTAIGMTLLAAIEVWRERRKRTKDDEVRD
jgi:hypothetical protein